MKISKTTSIAVICALSSLLVSNAATAAPMNAPANRTTQVGVSEQQVRTVLQALSAAASDEDAAKMASLFTLDGSYIDEDGVQTTGRAALKERFAAGLASQGKTKTTVNAQSIRRIGMNVAFVEGVTCKDSSNGPIGCARFTILLERQNNQWLIANATETEIATATARPSINPLNSLNWMIGSWTTAAGDAKVTMNADWVGNKNFILCKYTIERPSTQKKVDVQIIGYDPNKQAIVSWNFNSSGGFGSGTWSQQGKEWQIHSAGIEQAGVQTQATNIISRDGENKFSWRSIDRVFDGNAVPNTEPLIVERVGRITQ